MYVKQCSNVFQCFYVRIVLVAMECLSMVILNIFYFIIIYLFWNYLCTLNSYIYYLMYYNFEVIFEFEMFELSLFELCCCFTPEFRVVSLKKNNFLVFFLYLFFTVELTAVSDVTEDKNKSVKSLFKTLFCLRVFLSQKCIYLLFYFQTAISGESELY